MSPQQDGDPLRLLIKTHCKVRWADERGPKIVKAKKSKGSTLVQLSRFAIIPPSSMATACDLPAHYCPEFYDNLYDLITPVPEPDNSSPRQHPINAYCSFDVAIFVRENQQTPAAAHRPQGETVEETLRALQFPEMNISR